MVEKGGKKTTVKRCKSGGIKVGGGRAKGWNHGEGGSEHGSTRGDVSVGWSEGYQNRESIEKTRVKKKQKK